MKKQFIERLKQQAKELKIEIHTLYIVYRDPRVPLLARIFAGLVIGYAFSPIDLIPDFIPVIGILDDLILVPWGIKIALSMIPENVLKESREKARQSSQQASRENWMAVFFIISIWLLVAAFLIIFVMRIFKH